MNRRRAAEVLGSITERQFEGGVSSDARSPNRAAGSVGPAFGNSVYNTKRLLTAQEIPDIKGLAPTGPSSV